ncbi:helix-turn-helix transcriptional regulator [Acidovorax sp. Leaf78]|uniref:helix-turn-helix domain-containing protein n=1 Tax=Acidovorax sp. Leaf78 TaxID=1736237 RepID=UPI0006FAC9DA|nr:helix-turn-helix transcriptional regulator [Acidovorax sp. Leaf78]KQO24107.1 hypothetical protein ASF16_23640 [Acidovorax sp. Leaf78]
MSALRKGVTPDQLHQASKDLNLTVAAIAEGTGLSRAYISEFRSGKRNFKPSEQALLRSYLEAEYAEQGYDFPEEHEASDQELLNGLGGMVQRINRPAILLSEDVPKAQAEKLVDLIEANRLKVNGILDEAFETGGFLGGEFSPATENAIRETFALLALNYVAILMLQGRNIARQVPEGFTPKTMGDWLSSYLSTSPLAALLPADESATADQEAA